MVPGVLAALAAVVIGAGWQVATRLGVTTTLTPIDLALLRYGVPGLIMLPVAIRTGLLPKGVAPAVLAMMIVGAGAPFGLLAMTGSKFAPVAHMGVIIPGGMALGVAALSHFILGEKYSAIRIFGLGLLFAAIFMLGIGSFGAANLTTFSGDLLFLCAASIWAGYTVAYRKSGLNPTQATALVGFWSLLIVAPLWLVSPSAKLLSAPIQDIVSQFFWQSILAGIVAVWAYGTGVRRIGPANTAAIGALVPAVSSIAGVFVLGEHVSLVTAVAIVLAIVGVLLSTGYLERFVTKKV